MCRMLTIIFVGGLSLTGAARLSAQIPTIRVDLATRSFARDTLPFGQEFWVRGPVPANVDTVEMRYAAMGTSLEAVSTWVRDSNAVIPETEFRLLVARLAPDLRYRFSFVVKAGKKGTATQEYSITLNGGAGMAQPGSHLTGTIRESTAAATSSRAADTVNIQGDAPSRFQDHFHADFGLMRSFHAQYVGVTSNAHFYLAPINPNEDLTDLEDDVWQNFTKRVSVFAGLALQELSSEADVDALFKVGSPVAGIGVRGFLYWPGMSPRLRPLLQPLRLNTGVVWFEQDDANPLIDEKIRKRDWFISITGDIELKNILGPFDALF
jgi:hypothetical protein